MGRSPGHRALRHLARAPVSLYRWHLGWVLGQRFVLLVHTGRRSGLERRTVLEVVQFDAATRSVVVMSGFGRRSDWFRNIAERPASRLVIGRESFVPVHRVLGPEEAATALADYERRNRVVAPVVRWLLGRLVGWRYDGSEAARRQLVDALPLVRFWPAPNQGEPA